jgi:superfamily II RNA helicase
MVFKLSESHNFNHEVSINFSEFPMELSLFQKFAIEAIVKNQHSLSCVPTGSGKTLPALFAIKYFTKLGKRVIYTSPIKALSNQKFYEFSQKFPDISFGILTGDNKINPTANVLIMTAEILQHKLQLKKNIEKYKDDEIDFNEVGCVINDEIHMINDQDRGHVWENIILSLPSHIPMVLLSATLDKPENFAQWIESTNPTKLVYLAESHLRSVPLVHYSFSSVPKQIFKNLKNELKSEINEIKHKFIPIQDENGKFISENYNKVNTINKLLRKNNLKVNRTSLLNDLCDKMLEKDMFPAVCFLLSKKQIDTTATEITSDLLPFDSKIPYTIDKECDNFLRKKLTNYHEFFNLIEYKSLKKMLQKGIATHHSGMIPILRELVELLFEKGYIKLLFATETFSVGLNMPIRTTIFTDIHKFDGYSHRMFHSHEFIQACGRAGRRGIDKIGYVIHLINIYRPFDLTNYRSMMKGQPQALVSKYKFGYKLLFQNNDTKKSLLQNEINKNISQEMIHIKELQNIIHNDELKINFLQTKPENQTHYKILQNKKTKKNKFLLKQYEEEHPSLLKDIDFINKIEEKKIQLTKDLHYISESNSFIENNTKKIQQFLIQNEFLNTNYELTKKGNIANHIEELPSLIIADVYPILSKLETDDIIFYLSCFANIHIQDEYKKSFNEYDFKNLSSIIFLTESLLEKYENFEIDNNINTGENYIFHYDLLHFMKQWIYANNEQNCILFLNTIKQSLFIGDFIKAILKINNSVKQLEIIAENTGDLEFLQNLREIPSKTLKHIATNQSLYI